MTHAFALRLALLLGICALPQAVDAADGPAETLLLQSPAVSAKHVVFSHAYDLWVVDRAGGTARRLTSDVGRETSARISPDGKWVAYSAEYQGNADVYLISIDGGMPKRLTWHPDTDYVRDWHPDGKHVLFNSWRHGAPPVGRLYLASIAGGFPTPLEIPRVNHAVYGPGATHIAYTPILDAFQTWKRYRGGRTTPIWIYDVKSHEVEEVPHVNASDSYPAWVGDSLYFMSDRTNQMNLFTYKRGGKLEQLTHFKQDDFGIRALTAGGGVVAYERGGAIYLHDPKTRKDTRLTIHVPTDGLDRRPRWQSVGKSVRYGGISPNGKRAVFEARGEIITVPREHGAPRNLSATSGAHDRSPSWSPNGKQVAWFSDEGGEYQLVVRDRRGRKEPKKHKLDGAGYYVDPVWSPKGKRILFGDKANRLAYIDLKSGEITQVGKTQGSLGMWRPFGVWSKDGKWIAIETRNPHTAYGGVALYELATGKTTTVTDGFSSADSPVFSKDGKHMFFRASIDSGPRQFGLDMSASGRTSKSNLYVVVLKKDGAHPMGPRSDEGEDEKKKKDGDKKEDSDKKEDDEDKKDGDEDKKDGDEEDEKDKDRDEEEDTDDDGEKKDDDMKSDEEKPEEEKPEEKKKDKPKPPSIDLEDLDQRILALPLGGGEYYNLDTTSKGLIFTTSWRTSDLKLFDFKSRKAKKLMSGVSSVRVTPNGKHMLVKTGSTWSICNEGGKDKKTLTIASAKVRIEPEQEWPQILREVWRIQRDFFYDPQLHGVDWDAAWERWSALLPHVHHRGDLNLLIGQLIGELACGHEYVRGGEYDRARSGPSVGLLGADWNPDGERYRLTRIFRGQNWTPSQRAPLTEPGVDANEGDYLISVNGMPVTTKVNVFEAFTEMSGKPTEIELSANKDGSDSRTSTVVPISNENGLRRKAWIEANRARVDKLSKGRLAYVYMPNTGGAGKAAFDRDYFSQLHKEGLILDERYNGGGKVADYVVETLSREVLCYWMNREGWLARTPFGTLHGPKVMIINGRAGSGGDAMPWMFKKLRIGPTVGTRTWGGLVGISGYPPLMDGGSVTAANFGIMDTDGKWVVENVGVSPDHVVVEYPKDIIAGKDPQLEKAVALALEALERQPAKKAPTYTPPDKR